MHLRVLRKWGFWVWSLKRAGFLEFGLGFGEMEKRVEEEEEKEEDAALIAIVAEEESIKELERETET